MVQIANTFIHKLIKCNCLDSCAINITVSFVFFIALTNMTCSNDKQTFKVLGLL